jgi:NAD(P)-dependent dehydrogenase (short-subunit alcohol dehydrogenase family)
VPERPPPVLVFLIDAFRHDFLSEADTPRLAELASSGVRKPLQPILGYSDAILANVFYANAGISGGGQPPFFELTAEHWRQVLEVNLIGVFLAIKHAARVMVPNKKGSIVCTASVAGIRSGAGGGPYSASKAGVINLTTTAANYLAGTNVRVNAICPGIIETGMTKPIFDYARQRGSADRIGQLNPLKRYGVPEEIANMALFLASDEASYVNGQHIAVDGGLTSSMPVTGRIGR